MLVPYGDAPSAFGRLYVPESATKPPVVVLYHGGFWRRSGGDLNLMTPMAEALADAGYAVWNVEYGRTGERFGGWPYTFDHVLESLAALADLGVDYGLDTSRPIVVGHSAGGHLALWAGAQPVADVAGVIALAPIVDLELADENGLGNGAVADLLGGQIAEVPERFAEARIGDLGDVPAVVIVSALDDSVPARYSVGVRSDRLVEVRLDSASHLSMIRSGGDTWTHITFWIENVLTARE